MTDNIKAYEENQKKAKGKALQQFFDETVGDLKDVLTFERIFDRRYLNVSVTLAKAQKDIAEKVEGIRKDFHAIENVEEEYRIIVKDAYLRTFNLGQAMGEMFRMKELKRQEEERKSREAAEGEAREAAMREEAAREAAVKADAANTAENPHPEAEQLTISIGEQKDEASAAAETQSGNAAQNLTDNAQNRVLSVKLKETMRSKLFAPKISFQIGGGRL